LPSGRCDVSDSSSKGKTGTVEEILGYRFSDAALLEEALTHGSAVESGSERRDYDRLEFLGDAVLELITRDYLMRHHASEPEGRLTRRKANLVSAGNLASAGKRMGLDAMVRLGEEFDSSGCPDSVVADVVEAVIGALYIDGGLEEARRFVIGRVLLPTVETSGGFERDPKSRLQEFLQSSGRSLPRYRTLNRGGSDHEPLFHSTVRSGGTELGEGSGTSKKKAQQEAALDALSRLEGEGIDGL
jgi:ribonuclease-3